MKKLITMFLAVVMILGVVAIPAMAEEPGPVVTRVEIKKKPITVEVGYSDETEWQYYPDDAEDYSENTAIVNVKSTNPKVATGTATVVGRKFTAKGITPGIAYLTLQVTLDKGTDDERTFEDVVEVIVTPKNPEWCKIKFGDIAMRIDDAAKDFTCTIIPINHAVVPADDKHAGLGYSDMDAEPEKQIALISAGAKTWDEQAGILTFKFNVTPKNIGESKLTIWAQSTNGNKWHWDFKVSVLPTILPEAVYAADMAVEAGKTAPLVWKTEPEDAQKDKVIFESGNPLIATIDEKGIVTGVGEVGAQTWVKVTVITKDSVKDETRVLYDLAWVTVVPATAPANPPAEPKPPKTGMISLAVLGISAILTGAGVVLFRKK